MSLNDTMTALMDKAREITGLTEKINIAQLTSLMNHFDLHVNPNLLASTEFTVNVDKNYPMWSNAVIVRALQPGTYTLTWQASTTGTNKKVRVKGMDMQKKVAIPDTPGWGLEFDLSSDKKSFTFNVPNDLNSYSLLLYGSAGNNTYQVAPVKFYNVKLEVGDLATPLTTVGGGSN